MTFGRGTLLSQKYSSKTSAKTTKMILNVNDIKRARLNIFRKFVFHGTLYLVIGEKYV